jgi:hypothetical protein
MEVIFLPMIGDGEKDVKTLFLSPASKPMGVFQIACNSLDLAREGISNILRDKEGQYEKDEFNFVHGFDFNFGSAHVARAAYDFFDPRFIWNVPIYEKPEVNSHTFKQFEHPNIAYIHNFEPFIRYSKEVAISYYEAKYTSFGGSKYDDLKLEDSTYFKEVINSIRGLVRKKERIKIFSDYGTMLSGNLNMNGFQLTEDGGDCTVFLYPYSCKLSDITEELEKYRPRCVVFVGIGSPSSFDIVQPDLSFNYRYVDTSIINKALEVFMENKNIMRPSIAIHRLERA